MFTEGAMLKRKSESITLCCNIFNAEEVLLTNRINQFSAENSWFDVLSDLLEETNYTLNKNDAVTVSLRAKNAIDTFHPDLHENIEVAYNFDKSLKYASFKIKPNPDKDRCLNDSQTKNAFTIMMETEILLQQRPQKKDENGRFTAKDKMHNDLVSDMVSEKVFFPTSMSPSTVSQFVNTLVNVLWYIDGSKEKICTKCQSNFTFPKRFLENYNGYYDWRKHKKAAPKLTSEQLKLHSSAIFNVVAMPFTSAWGSFKYDLENLSLCLNSYAVDYLDKANKEQQERQSQDHPVRQVEVDTFLSYIPPTEEIDSKYVILDQILSKLGMYEYLYFDDTLHVAETFRSRFDKYSFIANLKLSCPVNVLQYTPGGQSGKTVFLWKVPEGRAISILMQETMQVVHDLKPRLHEYHTRYMRREFSKKYCNLNAVTIPKHILRAMYAELTGDASIDQNPCMDERVRQAVLAEDPELVLDLRHLNKGRPGNTFDAFFEVLNAKVEEMCAADERRHGIEHFAKYISVKDLIEDVKNDLNPDAPVPSESTVLFSFTPKNSYLNSAKLYTARVPLQFKVQTRQLRLQHQDDHFCAAQFKYMRHFAVQFSDNVTFLSIDDKSKIDIGEPGQTVSTGVRGKKSIVPMGSSLSALDHDVSSKGSLTPSVCLKVEIPEEKDGSFYRGKVFVCYKDSIFQPSSPWRHAAEMTKILQMDDNVKPVLMIFSDGGPDHRLTYHSVKLSLIILFKNLDLDLLIAGRTAPGHSWLNPVERIMSTLNIALQNVALSRTECSSEIEQVLKSANCMADIRRKAEKVSGLKDAWISSLQGIVELLEERTQKVSLKGVPFECVEASSEEEVLAVEEKVVHVDQNIEIGKYHTKDLSKKRDYLTFLADHCIQRQYLFQIKKCQNVQCCKPRRCTLNLPNMPDPVLSADKQHYQNFEDLLGQATTDADRPSFSNQSVTAVAEALQGAKAKDLTGQNVRKIVTCVECGKPRCIYARKALTVRELRALVRLLEKYDYSCGSLITPDGDALQGIIFVRLQINCNSAIEFPYYSTDKCPTRKDLCCYCATEGAIKDEDLLKEFRVVLPMCRDCKLLGREAPKRNPINKK